MTSFLSRICLLKAAEDSDHDQRPDILKQVQESSIAQRAESVESDDQNIHQPGELYRRYRLIEELSEDARALYEMAGKFSVLLGI